MGKKISQLPLINQVTNDDMLVTVDKETMVTSKIKALNFYNSFPFLRDYEYFIPVDDTWLVEIESGLIDITKYLLKTPVFGVITKIDNTRDPEHEGIVNFYKTIRIPKYFNQNEWQIELFAVTHPGASTSLVGYILDAYDQEVIGTVHCVVTEACTWSYKVEIWDTRIKAHEDITIKLQVKVPRSQFVEILLFGLNVKHMS